MAAAGSAPRPPNVVVLLADDAAWGDFSFNGNSNLATPHIDRIAREGAVFERFYVSPVCVPTRAEFLTGRYALRTGVRGLHGGQERFDLDEKTIADAFKAAGYATGAFGKWHNGAQGGYYPTARGFDEFYGFTTGHSGYYFDAPLEHNGRSVRGRGYIADDLTDRALAFIERHRARPFFCYVPFNTPHTPFSVPDADWDRFKDRPLARRAREGSPEDLAATRAALAMCENLDRNVGRILDRLAALHLDAQTIVVFFSDNGPAYFRWNGDLKGKKGTLDEGGLRAPFAMRWPGCIQPGTTVSGLTAAIDLLPTLTALAGIAPVGTKPLDGRDFSPLLFASQAPWPDRQIFAHLSWNRRVGVRTSRYRLDGVGALFDLETDPGQRTNIAAQKPAIAAELTRAVAAWRADIGPLAAASGAITDDRPLPVGFPGLPETTLSASDGTPSGGIERSAKAPNSSYFTAWRNAAGVITWDVEVLQPGDYTAILHYTCAAADIGSTVELRFQNARLEGRIAEGWDPPLLHEDRVPRDTESYLKEFRPLVLGTIRLGGGRGPLTLRASHVAATNVMDLYGLTLVARDPVRSTP